MTRACLTLFALLAGCGADEDDDSAILYSVIEECDPHPLGAPCCPRVELDVRDCPEGSTVASTGVGEPNANTLTFCTGPDGQLDPEAPYTSVENASGKLVGVRLTYRGPFQGCWLSTGYQRHLVAYEPLGDGQCLRDCYDETGAPVDCAVANPRAPVCDEG